MMELMAYDKRYGEDGVEAPVGSLQVQDFDWRNQELLVSANCCFKMENMCGY